MLYLNRDYAINIKVVNVHPKIVHVDEAFFYSNLTLKLKKKLIKVFKFQKKYKIQRWKADYKILFLYYDHHYKSTMSPQKHVLNEFI